MGLLTRYTRAIDAISEVMGWVSMFLVVVTVAIGFYNVMARYVGRFIGVTLSSNLYIELQWYLYSLVFLLGFSYILKHGINVRVDFLYAKWSTRRKAIIDFWGHLLFLVPFTILGIWVSINPVLSSWGRRPNGSWGSWELSPDPSGLPRAPIKSMIVVGFVLLLLQAIAELIKLALVIRGREEFVDAVIHADEEFRPVE